MGGGVAVCIRAPDGGEVMDGRFDDPAGAASALVDDPVDPCQAVGEVIPLGEVRPSWWWGACQPAARSGSYGSTDAVGDGAGAVSVSVTAAMISTGVWASKVISQAR